MKNTAPTLQTGMSMIEVLVAIVILSLGLLGLAGLQATGLKSSYSAHTRAQASFYAQDMLDRMRANRAGALHATVNYNLSLAGTTPTCDTVIHCDQADWLADAATLPTGDGSIAVNAATSVATITIQWDDSRAGGSATEQLVLESQL